MTRGTISLATFKEHVEGLLKQELAKDQKEALKKEEKIQGRNLNLAEKQLIIARLVEEKGKRFNRIMSGEETIKSPGLMQGISEVYVTADSNSEEKEFTMLVYHVSDPRDPIAAFLADSRVEKEMEKIYTALAAKVPSTSSQEHLRTNQGNRTGSSQNGRTWDASN